MKHDCGRELIARAIIIRNDAILVNQNTNKKTGTKYFALPGGHVDPGESCPAAVQREFREELKAGVKIGELKFVSESIYPGRKKAEKPRHELVLYYEGELQGDLPEKDGRIISPEPQKNFRWLPLSELPESNLVPSSFKQFLMQQSSALYAFDDSTR
jgi:ADP-ribose pyrophosphatase YjhB (NUDIX family)